jgi:hypothetical protein
MRSNLTGFHSAAKGEDTDSSLERTCADTSELLDRGSPCEDPVRALVNTGQYDTPDWFD